VIKVHIVYVRFVMNKLNVDNTWVTKIMYTVIF